MLQLGQCIRRLLPLLGSRRLELCKPCLQSLLVGRWPRSESGLKLHHTLLERGGHRLVFQCLHSHGLKLRHTLLQRPDRLKAGGLHALQLCDALLQRGSQRLLLRRLRRHALQLCDKSSGRRHRWQRNRPRGPPRLGGPQLARLSGHRVRLLLCATLRRLERLHALLERGALRQGLGSGRARALQCKLALRKASSQGQLTLSASIRSCALDHRISFSESFRS